MELDLTLEQKQKLKELHSIVNEIAPNTSVLFYPTHCKVIAPQGQTIVLLDETQAPPPNRSHKIEDHIYDAIHAGLDFDLDIFVTDDYINLFKIACDPTKSNGRQIFAFSQAWELVEPTLNCGELTLTALQREVNRYTEKNGKRLCTIAQRSYLLMKVIGEFPIRDFKVITPQWLWQLSQPSFDFFLQRCRFASQHFAGAQ